ncbi:hypothetical protein BKA70DRAFT_851242 [Coprinopsis sp. MPI-PUGE-AT-0042]|nr:hypothetical protein BKA70DRAFT_851242 [Coprinopsis sp. MPI-PUGE-AT-0042]
MLSQRTDAPPPDYGSDSTGPPLSPPGYTFPTSFTVGDRQTDGLLVTIPQVKGHLALLHAFSKLKQDVAEWKGEVLHMPADAEKRWAWFVNMSVERFDRWAAALCASDLHLPQEILLPPIDILMVWHSYMLNPGGINKTLNASRVSISSIGWETYA